MSVEWKWAGAKWWKFDFHSHTPASDDYGRGPDQAALKAMSPKEWLLGYMRAGIDCVAITDHNSGAWIDSLAEAYQNLETEGPSDFRPLYLFPAVEITVDGNLHFLAIMDLPRKTADIDALRGAVRYRGTDGKSDQCTECSAVEVIDEIVKAGAVAIPAHVDKRNGLFQIARGNTLQQILNQQSLFAMEVVDPSVAKPATYTDMNLRWAEVLGSDSHHPSGTAGQRFPGSHFTWVKMTTPSLDGLRLALIDGNLSLKRSDVVSSDPNVHSPLAVEKIQVNDAKYLGCGNPFVCQLNPWLNTIIGGRGTGKSTALEFLRLALKRSEELPRALKDDFAKYRQASANRHGEGLLRDTTTICVYFRKDDSRFRVTWSKSDDSYRIEEEGQANEWRATEGDIAQRFPIRMYSQKQVFELAKHPHALLQVVDASPEVDARDWRLAWDELESQYLSICAQAREVQAGLQEETVVKGQLDDVKRKLEVFEKAGHAGILKDYQLRRNQAKAIDSWEESWSGGADRVRDLSKDLQLAALESDQISPETEEGKELTEEVEKVRSSVATARQSLDAIATSLDKTLTEWRGRKPNLKMSQAIRAAEERYKELIEQLSDAGAGGPAEYGVLVKQRQDLEEKLKGFQKKRQTLDTHRQNAAAVLDKLAEHRTLIASRREQFLQKVLSGNSYVQINVLPFGNRDLVENDIRRLVDRGDGGFERDIGTLDGGEGLLTILADDNLGAMTARVQLVKDRLIGIYANDKSAVDTAKDKRFVAHIQGLAPEQIDRIRCWFPEDSLDVQYSLKDGAGFKPVEQGSPGQKTAALLAFILSYGDEPLILDQPEDDLDNHLIYDLIVTQLREIKPLRQIIIVTHNANIVVNGDAENVVALDVRAGQTRIVCQGSLQETSIRDEVCRVMEGGKEAFDQRYRRIRAGK